MSGEIEPSDFNIPSTDELRQLRILAGKTQTEIADELGVHKTTVYRWENGTGSPGISDVRQMLDIFASPEFERLSEAKSCPMCGEGHGSLLTHLPECSVNDLENQPWELNE